MNTKTKKETRERRKKKVRSRISGTGSRPRLSVFKSNRYISAQLIDDETGRTLAQASSKGLKEAGTAKGAGEAGKMIAEAAKGKKIESVVFDRGGFLYAGRVKALADGAREAGLKF